MIQKFSADPAEAVTLGGGRSSSEFDSKALVRMVPEIAQSVVRRLRLPEHFATDVESELQEVFLHLGERAGKKAVDNPKAFLFASARHSALKLRKQFLKFTSIESAPTAKIAVEFDPCDRFADRREFDPAEFWNALERFHDMVQFARLGMSPDDREVFERRISGMKFDHIAEELNQSGAAVRRRYYRLSDKLALAIFAQAKADPILRQAVPSIFRNIHTFHRSVLFFMGGVARFGGFAAMKESFEFTVDHV